MAAAAKKTKRKTRAKKKPAKRKASKKTKKKATKKRATRSKNSGKAAKAKPRGRPFKPGQSGNPKGRPKLDVHVRELAREQTVPAINTLTAALEHESGSVRCRAADALLDRGWGRPTQPVEASGPDGGPIAIFKASTELAKLNDEALSDLERIIEDAIAQAATASR